MRAIVGLSRRLSTPSKKVALVANHHHDDDTEQIVFAKEEEESSSSSSDALVSSLKCQLEQTQCELTSLKARRREEGDFQLLEEKIITLERERSDILNCVGSITMNLESTLLRSPLHTNRESSASASSPLDEDEGITSIRPCITSTTEKTGSNNSTTTTEMILSNLKAVVALIQPLQTRLLSAETERKELRTRLTQQEKDHRNYQTEMKQASRKRSDDLWLKENEIKRLKQEVEALESEVAEAHKLAEAHDALTQMPISSSSVILPNLQPPDRLTTSSSEDSTTSATTTSSSCSASSSVREKLRKKRESESRFRQRFQGHKQHQVQSQHAIMTSDQGQQQQQHSMNPALEWKFRLLGINLATSSSNVVAGAGHSDSESCTLSITSCGGSTLSDRGEESKYDGGEVEHHRYSSLSPLFYIASSRKIPGKSILKVRGGDILEEQHRLTQKQHQQQQHQQQDKLNCKKQPDSSSNSSPRGATSLVAIGGGNCDNNAPRCAAVSFQTVQVRTYAQTLGDNPSVTFGPPICLDWKFQEEPPVDIDEFENNRDSTTVNHYKELFLSSMIRNRILKNQGFTDRELDQATKQTTKARWERMESEESTPPTEDPTEAITSTTEPIIPSNPASGCPSTTTTLEDMDPTPEFSLGGDLKTEGVSPRHLFTEPIVRPLPVIVSP